MTKKAKKIAIDAGTHTGLAIMDNRTGKILDLLTADFWGAFEFICAFDPAEVEIVMEQPQGKVYARLDNGFVKRAGDKIASNVGGVKRESELLASGLERKGFEVRRVLPVRAAKWTAEQLRRVTGWTKRTNNHQRDAARLCYY